jgi:mycothiol S-conjugate amidase
VTLRLLAVHAHPDDESSKGAGSYAYYRSIGAEVMVVSCTGGERGDVQNDALEAWAMAERDMAGLRRIEMSRAQAALGIEHRWLGYLDSGLPDNGEEVEATSFAAIPLEFSGAPLVKIIREFRPQVLVTYDENGGYPHPDHVRTHEVSMYAFAAAADGERYPELGAPWQISKVYYDRMFTPHRFQSMYDELVSSEPESPLVARLVEFRERFADRPAPAATTSVNVGEFFERRDDALRSHASQVPPDSAFFFWPNDLQRKAWPYEDYQLAVSLVESELPESDLFAGITDNENTNGLTRAETVQETHA